MATKAAVDPAADKGDTTTTTKKDDGKDDSGKKDPDKDDDCKPTTTTTEKGGKGTTTTTRKGGDGKDGDGKGTTTTTEKDRPTTTTTEKRDTVEPTTPDPGSGGPDSGGSTDPGSTPIEPQEAPPFDPSYDEPADDPSADPVDGGWYDMPEQGPIAAADDEYAFGPIAAPGEAEPVIPTFSNSKSRSRSEGRVPERSDRRSRRGPGTSNQEELAAPPLVVSSSGSVQASTGQSHSAAVSRQLGGVQTSVNESALPASVISTPKIFPINRRDPLAAAALVLLVGVSRELFKIWRRRATDYWPA